MMADFLKTFKPTPLEELESCKFMLKLHQEQIGHCCTCIHYKSTDMPGFVTDYGECMVNEPGFVNRVCALTDEKIDPCKHYEDDLEYVNSLRDEIDRLEKDAVDSFHVSYISTWRKGDDPFDRIVDLVYGLLDEYDIETWQNIEYIDLAGKWVEIVYRYGGAENILKAKLKEYLKGE